MRIFIKFIAGLLFALVFTPAVAEQGGQPVEAISLQVAIFPCKPLDNITVTEASFVTDRITLETIKQGVYAVIDKYEIEKRISPDLLSAYDTASSITPFFALAERCKTPVFIWGKLSKNVSSVQLDLLLGDAASRQVKNSVSIAVPGSTFDLAEQIAPMLVKLFNLAVTSEGGKTVYTPLLPPRPSSLIVHSDPEGATVLLNDVIKGETPFRMDSINDGSYSLALERKGYSRFFDHISITPGSDKKILVHLDNIYGAITIRSSPSRAKVALSNGITGVSPFTCDTIRPGKFLLRLSLDGYVPDSQTISVNSGKHDTLNFSLIPRRYIDSINQVKHLKNQRIRRIVFGSVTGAFLSFGVYYNFKAQKSIERENDAYAVYRNLNDGNTPDEFDAAYSKYNRHKKESESLCTTRNVHYILAGLASIGLAVSIPF
jgi:hypothetical protein